MQMNWSHGDLSSGCIYTHVLMCTLVLNARISGESCRVSSSAISERNLISCSLWVNAIWLCSLLIFIPINLLTCSFRQTLMTLEHHSSLNSKGQDFVTAIHLTGLQAKYLLLADLAGSEGRERNTSINSVTHKHEMIAGNIFKKTHRIIAHQSHYNVSLLNSWTDVTVPGTGALGIQIMRFVGRKPITRVQLKVGLYN